jgi:hypothetical protein
MGSGVLRFLVEFIRRPDERPDRVFGLRDAHLVAVGQAAFGLVLLLAALLKSGNAPVALAARDNDSSSLSS